MENGGLGHFLATAGKHAANNNVSGNSRVENSLLGLGAQYRGKNKLHLPSYHFV